MLGLDRHPDFGRAVPTPDHYIPMLYLAGLAAAAGDTAHVLEHGYFGGSLSMTSYALGVEPPVAPGAAGGAPPLPDVAPETTNL